jgi:hypothetical protein
MCVAQSCRLCQHWLRVCVRQGGGPDQISQNVHRHLERNTKVRKHVHLSCTCSPSVEDDDGSSCKSGGHLIEQNNIPRPPDDDQFCSLNVQDTCIVLDAHECGHLVPTHCAPYVNDTHECALNFTPTDVHYTTHTCMHVLHSPPPPNVTTFFGPTAGLIYANQD